MKHTHYIIILLLIYSCTHLTAQIRYVSKTGSSTPPYTSWATASDSIQKCIDICNDGDTVIVGNGVYKEFLVLDSTVTLLGMSMDSTVIDGTDLTDITIYGNANIKMDNFYLKGKAAEPLTAVVMVVFGKNKNSFNNLRIENSNGGIGIEGGEIKNSIFYNISRCIVTSSLFNTDTFYISNNICYNNLYNGKGIYNIGGGAAHFIHNNIFIGIHKYLYSGIELSSGKHYEIKNNLVTNYAYLNLFRSGSAILDTGFVINNVFLQNNLDGKRNIQITPGNKTLFRNNIIGYTKNRLAVTAHNNLHIDYNLFWKNDINYDGTYTLGEHNVYLDPMFVKDTVPLPGGSYDFHLQAYSPAIDAGDTNILDVDGSRSDIGLYGGPLGEAYSYIDLPPRPPNNIKHLVISDSNKIKFKWGLNTESDFRNYIIYKDTVTGFIPSQVNKYLVSYTSSFEDYYTQSDKNLYYKITAVDSNDNESEAVEEVSVVLTGLDEPEVKVVKEYALYQNYPNPFNPETKISYSIRENGYVKVMVYDIKGERIRILVNEEKEAGYYETSFNAEGLSSGIYIYRIEVIGKGSIPRFSDLKKMILIK